VDVLDVLDLLLLLGQWGCTTDCQADINDDGVVDVLDLTQLLAAWGLCTGAPETLGTVTSLASHLTAAGLSQADWDDMMDVLDTGTEADVLLYTCWMKNHLTQCINCPPCSGADPY